MIIVLSVLKIVSISVQHYLFLKISQEKENKALKGWTKDIVNHYWHCSEVSNTYEEFVVSFFAYYFWIFLSVHVQTDSRREIISFHFNWSFERMDVSL